MSAWELVNDAGCNGTQRLKVPGGWIYKVWERNLDGDQPQDTLAAVFVPALDAPAPPAEVPGSLSVEAIFAAWQEWNGPHEPSEYGVLKMQRTLEAALRVMRGGK